MFRLYKAVFSLGLVKFASVLLPPGAIAFHFSTRVGCQYTPSELLVVWLNSFTNSLPLQLSDVGLGGTASNNFCNFLETTIRHSHSFHVVIDQLCGESKQGLNFSLKLSFFNSLNNYFCYFVCLQPSATL